TAQQRSDYVKQLADIAAANAALTGDATPAPVQVQVPVEAMTIGALPANLITYQKHWLSDNAYLTLFTMHATMMIFFVLMPVLLGTFANFLIPLMIGARDMAFPKLNMLSFWISVPAGVVMLASFWVPGGAA